MHIGIDICSVARLQRALHRSPQLLDEVFSPHEIAYCQRQRRPPLHLAARWAAKEAVVKSCGADLLACDLRRLWVESTADRPRLHVQCDVLRAHMHAVSSASPSLLSLSLSHDDAYAVACVVLP